MPRAAVAKIDALCREAVADGHTPGLVLLVGRGDRTLLHRAYGRRVAEPHPSEAMTTTTLFDIASLTKPVCTAPAILLLAQDGRLALDDPVARHVPEFRRKDKRDITIRHLLTQTSGLPSYMRVEKVEKECGPRPNADGLIARIARARKTYATGKDSRYSCLGYLVLARVVRNVSGRNLPDFLRERLWAKLGMADTTFSPDAAQTRRTAPTQATRRWMRRGKVQDPLAWYATSPGYAPGNAGAFATAADLGRFARLLLNGGRVGGEQILTTASLRLMLVEQTVGMSSRFTCGWEIAERPAYLTVLNQRPETACLIHTGYTGTLIWIDKLSRAYVVFLGNTTYPGDSAEARQAVILMRRELVGTILDHLEIYKGVARPEAKD